MKLLRYGSVGKERPGMLDTDGVIRDLSEVVSDISGHALSNRAIDKLRTLDAARLPPPAAGVRIGPPLLVWESSSAWV